MWGRDGGSVCEMCVGLCVCVFLWCVFMTSYKMKKNSFRVGGLTWSSCFLFLWHIDALKEKKDVRDPLRALACAQWGRSGRCGLTSLLFL